MTDNEIMAPMGRQRPPASPSMEIMAPAGGECPPAPFALEIMAPAGGHSQLLAAVRCGADAVYLGAGAFNARQSAENFSGDSLCEAVSYCHARGVAVYVTLNTLITDGETADFLREAEKVAASGCDAVIVQDLGVARLLRACCPSLPLFASTQMSVHNVSGALALEELGFARLVLARELSQKEIRAIKDATAIQLEAFVHGALCMSVSGQCYLSSMLGGRSGNRGLCAQPCRLDFSSGGRHHVLSLKDLTLTDKLRDLADCGVTAVKIEGRLKRPEYVAAAVTACRQALGGQPPDLKTLQAVFSRSGFTDGYFTGQRGLSMFGMRTKEDVEAATPEVLGPLEELYRHETPLIPVEMSLCVTQDAPVTLTVTDGVHTAAAVGEPPQAALTRPTDEELARRGLEKTGGTPFFLANLNAEIAPGLMVPVSVLNSLRRAALEELLTLRSAVKPHAFTVGKHCPFPSQPREDVPPMPKEPKIPALRIRLSCAAQLSDPLLAAAQKIILPVEDFAAQPALLRQLGEKAAAALPLLCFPGQEDALTRSLAALKASGLRAVLAGNLGAIRLGRSLGLELLGDYSLNILNSTALSEYARLGLCDATLSIEGSLRHAAALEEVLPCGVIAYGLLPLMTLRNCPAQSGKGGCGPCTGRSHITDRRGDDFPILCHDKAYAQLLNPIPLWLGDKQNALAGLSFATLYFTTESREQCADITRRFVAGEPYLSGEKRTGGMYFRELL